MVNEITTAVRTQFLGYWDKAVINARPSGRSVSARVAEHTLNPSAPLSGQIVLDGFKGSAVVSLSLDSAYKILSTLERLEAGLAKALDDGTTLAGNTEQPSYYTWRNTLVSTGVSHTSITAYEYGDRSGDITVTASYGLIAGGVPSNAVDGEYGYDATNGWWTNDVDVQGHWINFDFGTSRVVDEVTWQSLGSETHGTWVWQGSNDGNTYYAIGESFTLGGEGTQVQDTLKDNTTGYRHYRLYGTSGTAGTQLQQEVFFKVIDAYPAPATQAQVLTSASLNVIDEDLRQGRAAVDNLVSASETFGVNLLSSYSRSVLVRATKFGGTLTVAAQPLDAQALGLTGLRALSQADAETSHQALQNAIAATKARIDALHDVSSGLRVGKGALSGDVAKGSGAILPGGSLVDLLA